ncbi:hypothetical protein GBA52_008474 [Prunus armeniaca]|nr:hypothetical protein GBA52_008474 [Prunus armeniaca]
MTKVEKENHVDYKSSSADIRCSTHYFMEKQAQVVYTIAKFKEFQDELTEAHQCDKMQKTFDEIKELATDSKEKCVIVMAWM